MAKALACVAREAEAFQAAIFDGSYRYQSHIFLKLFCNCFFSLLTVVQSRGCWGRYLKECFVGLHMAPELQC